MSFLNIFIKKDPPPQKQTVAEDEQFEEYVIASFVPKKIPMTSDIARRKREDELRGKYCSPSVKTGSML